ncbi:MAG TPA: dephospho-CoA kinase [Verrucomicrobiae bacterium]|nr:dephospho-CoA kinase [Verrucomicrobiae bacterium]
MVLVGLTGGVGMGKSTVAQFLAARGEKLIDTDLLARDLVAAGQPALEEIREQFGSTVFSREGKLDRKALGAMVFNNSERRQKLEAILHPRIRQAWREQAEKWREAGIPRGVVVIPLLYETGAEAELDKVVCVACSALLQRFRLKARQWSEQEISARVKAQWPSEKKQDRADGVIWNESTLEICEEQTARIFGSTCFRSEAQA